MVLELILRFVGMIVFGVIGWQLGEYLAGSSPSDASIRYVVVLMLAGVAFVIYS